MGGWHWIYHRLIFFCTARRDFLFMSTQAQAVQDFYCYDGAFPAFPSASFYGDPAGRWKTPANENLLLGVAWDSIVFWYAILARGEKMEVLFSCYKNSSHWLPARLQGLKKKWESPRGSSRIQCCSMVFKKCRPSNHTATPAPEFLTCGCSEALASVTSPLAGVWFRSIPRIQRSGMNIYNHMI